MNLGYDNDLVIVDPGAVFDGNVVAHGNGNTLELTASKKPLKLDGLGIGLGSQFTGFQTLLFDRGARWDVIGSFAGVKTIAGIAIGDTLDLTSLSYSAGDIADLADGNVLEIRASGGALLWSVHLASPTLGTPDYSGKVFVLSSDGAGGTDVNLNFASAPGSVSWKNGKPGNWAGVGNWTPGFAPNSADTDATIAVAGAIVSIRGGQSFTVGQLTIDDGAQFNLLGGLTAAGGVTGTAGFVALKGGTLTGSVSLGVAGELAGDGTVDGAIANSAQVYAKGGLLTVTGDVTGTGSLGIGRDATLELGGNAADQRIMFVPFPNKGETLILDHPGGSFGTIYRFGIGDTIDLRGVTATSDGFNDGMLTVYDGTTTVATLSFRGGYADDTFALSSDGGGTDITLAPTPPSPGAANRRAALFAEAIAAHSGGLSASGDIAIPHRLQDTALGTLAASSHH